MCSKSSSDSGEGPRAAASIDNLQQCVGNAAYGQAVLAAEPGSRAVGRFLEQKGLQGRGAHSSGSTMSSDIALMSQQIGLVQMEPIGPPFCPAGWFNVFDLVVELPPPPPPPPPPEEESEEETEEAVAENDATDRLSDDSWVIASPQPLPAAVRYRCVAKSVIRAGFEMGSAKAGVLSEGEEVEGLEERPNEKGTVRVRIGEGRWVSMTSSAGATILAPSMVGVGGGGEGGGPAMAAHSTMALDVPEGPKQPAPPAESPSSYRCVRKSVIRAGVALDSPRAGVLAAGVAVVVYEEDGNRVRIGDEQWVSKAASNGDTILVPVVDSSTAEDRRAEEAEEAAATEAVAVEAANAAAAAAVAAVEAKAAKVAAAKAKAPPIPASKAKAGAAVPANTTSVGGYHCVAKSIIRTQSDMGSPKAGVKTHTRTRREARHAALF